MTDPLHQRKALEKQMEGAWREYNHSTHARQKAEVELAQAKRALAHMQKMRPSGRATDRELVAAEERVAKAEAAHALWYQRTNEALDAARALEADRDDLLAADPAAYAQEADRSTQVAVQALARAQGAIRDAQEAWQRAEAAWQPLVRALRLEPVPPWPLSNADDLLSQAPRPRQVTVPPG